MDTGAVALSQVVTEQQLVEHSESFENAIAGRDRAALQVSPTMPMFMLSALSLGRVVRSTACMLQRCCPGHALHCWCWARMLHPGLRCVCCTQRHRKHKSCALFGFIEPHMWRCCCRTFAHARLQQQGRLRSQRRGPSWGYCLRMMHGGSCWPSWASQKQCCRRLLLQLLLPVGTKTARCWASVLRVGSD